MRTVLPVALLCLAGLALVLGCEPAGTGPDGNNDGNNDGNGGGTGGGGDTTNFASVLVDDGEEQRLATPGADIDGDCNIAGTLRAEGEVMVVRVRGDLTVDGTLSAGDGAPTGEYDPEIPLSDQTVGIYIVADGDVTFGENAVIDTNGPVVITDDETLLAQTGSDIHAEAESASGTLPTLVPLPPDDAAFAEAQASGASPVQARAGRQVTIRGRTDASRLQGDRPVILFRFNNAETLNLRNWALDSPPGVPGANQDQTANPDDSGTDAAGGNGKNGMNLLIWNNNGPINVQGQVTLNLTNGGDGGSATAECATATGGNGGKAGNFRMAAAGGIDLTEGELIINPGRGGHGGDATVTGDKGATGCPGEPGCDTTAIGGKGGANEKRLFVRGAVDGIENITMGEVIGGNGGAATATGGEGGDGEECCDGGPGGAATATGGAGGAASANVGNLPVTVGGATGGAGGKATATGGDGGDGGFCKLDPGGNGGAGGDATATGGVGGSGTVTSGAGGPAGQGGDGGDATATGGNGGAGGDSVVQPGTGGAGGGGTATEGAAGGGDTPGNDGTPTPTDGTPGPDGVLVPPTLIWCFGFLFLSDAYPSGTVPTGTYTGPLFDETRETQVGTMPVELLPGGEYFTQANPPHIGYTGCVQYDISDIALTSGAPGDVVGVRLTPLYGQGVSQSSPVVVSALDANGQPVGDAVQIPSIPDNRNVVGEPHTIDVTFTTGGKTITAIRVFVTEPAFVTFWWICIFDP